MSEARAPFDPVQFERLSSGGVPGYDALQDLVALAAATVAGPAPRILDLGCGTGAGVLALARAVPEATIEACDPVPAMIAAARSRCEPLGERVSFTAGSIADLPLGPAFDVVVCTLVLQFVPVSGRAAFLAAIRERLRPGGSLIITSLRAAGSPEAQSLWERARRHHALARGISLEELNARKEQTRGHVHPLGPAEIEGLLGAAGFGDPIALVQLLAVHTWIASVPS